MDLVKYTYGKGREYLWKNKGIFMDKVRYNYGLVKHIY